MKTPVQNLLMTGTMLILILAFTQGYAQQKGLRKNIREKIEARHIAFLTEKMELNSEEAEKFWPVYNEFRDKRKQLNRESLERKQMKREDFEKLSDAELAALADQELVTEQKILDLRKEYHQKFKSVLPPRKLFRFYEAERQFKKLLLKRLQERRERAEPH